MTEERTDPAKRVVVLTSGGLDSCVLLAKAVDEFDHVYPLTFRYGSTHNEREVEAARRIVRHFGLQFHMKTLAPMFANSALIDGRGGDYIPARNTVFLAVATAYALGVQAGHLWIGATREDQEGFPDCRPAYIAAFAKAVRLGTVEGMVVAAPFVEWSKAEVIRHGRDLEAPISLTYSCYKGQQRACGRCLACRIRDRAFVEAGPA